MNKVQEEILTGLKIWSGHEPDKKLLYKRAMMALDRSPELKLAMEVMASVEYEMPIKGFSCFSSGSHFVQWSKTILAIFVESHSRNISMKLS